MYFLGFFLVRITASQAGKSTIDGFLCGGVRQISCHHGKVSGRN
ncbi:MAG: hypothetical protein Q8K83_09600 [Methylotenera sp.]|nr:hypothetical protein [Methylotenera sp.]